MGPSEHLFCGKCAEHAARVAHFVVRFRTRNRERGTDSRAWEGLQQRVTRRLRAAAEPRAPVSYQAPSSCSRPPVVPATRAAIRKACFSCLSGAGANTKSVTPVATNALPR